MRSPSHLESCQESNQHPPSPFTAQWGDPRGRPEDPGTYEQLALSPWLHWAEKGDRLRDLLARTIELNRLTHEELSAQTKVDSKQLGRTLKHGGGAHPPLALVACILWHDRRGVFLSSLADSLGYELTPKKPDLAAENRRLRDALAQAVQALQAVTTP